MKFLNKASIAAEVALTLGLLFTNVASAATSPSLGLAETYGLLGGTFTPNGGSTTITGDVGYTTLSAGLYTVVGGGVDYGSGAPTPTARTNAGTALTNLNNQSCTFTFPGGAIDLATDTTHGLIGVYTPGVYCVNGAASIGTAGIYLNGAGTYIFKVVGALTSVPNSSVILAGGASSCDVFWAPTAATTLAANTAFAGTLIDNANAITVGANTTWKGRALSLGAGVITTDTDTITSTCSVGSVVAPVPASGHASTINVVKMVINDNGGTKKVSDFPLFVNGTPVISGKTNNFQAPGPAYTITETSDPNYTRTFSGDCDSNGQIGLVPGNNKFCIITNNDIGAPASSLPTPPMIDVVKVPSPLSLPSGPGTVTYAYTLKNIGTVPVTDITMVGDTCGPIVLVSGDLNNDSKLDVPETWVYRCSTTLTETHTNTVTTHGWANGLSTVDIASATVIVGKPIVPPLIHVTKIPSPLILPVGGGIVTYVKRVTNPGTIALSNIRVTDDKCSPVEYVSGDLNKDLKLDPTEMWTYLCRSNLSQTTTNTATASGEANGLTATDIAVATVLVPIPGLPNTGINIISWGIVTLAGLFGLSLSFYFARKKQLI